MMKKRAWIVGAGIVAVASLAFAGRAERERQRELEPKITTASASVSATCGCAPEVKVDWETFKTVESMYTVDFAVDSYREIAEDTCKADKEAKDGFCSNVKNVLLKWTAEAPTAACAG